MTPVYQLKPIAAFFNFKTLLQAKIEKKSSIHNIVFSTEKADSGEKYAQIKHCLQMKIVLNKVDGFVS